MHLLRFLAFALLAELLVQLAAFGGRDLVRGQIILKPRLKAFGVLVQIHLNAAGSAQLYKSVVRVQLSSGG